MVEFAAGLPSKIRALAKELGAARVLGPFLKKESAVKRAEHLRSLGKVAHVVQHRDLVFNIDVDESKAAAEKMSHVARGHEGIFNTIDYYVIEV